MYQGKGGNGIRDDRAVWGSSQGLEIRGCGNGSDECGKVLTSKRNHLQHQGTHIGEKPSECVKYEDTFRTSSQLGDHEHVYPGGKPVLDICGFGLPEFFTPFHW